MVQWMALYEFCVRMCLYLVYDAEGGTIVRENIDPRFEKTRMFCSTWDRTSECSWKPWASPSPWKGVALTKAIPICCSSVRLKWIGMLGSWSRPFRIANLRLAAYTSYPIDAVTMVAAFMV